MHKHNLWERPVRTTRLCLSNSGVIPFCANEFGFNPGALLETYLEALHPEYEFMFQRPRRAGKNFNINTAKVLFEDSKLGKNTTPLCMPKTCKLLDLPRRYTNHCVRTTGINLLKRSGIDDRDIVKLSGHKAVSSLSHYNPHNNMEKKIAMAGAMLLSKRPLEVHQPSEPGLENVELSVL